MRSCGYSVALGFSFASLASLSCRSASPSSAIYTILPAASFVLLPLLSLCSVYVIESKWNVDKVKDLQVMVRDFASKVTYEERLVLGTTVNATFHFQSALLVSSYPDFLSELNSRLQRVVKLLQLPVSSPTSLLANAPTGLSKSVEGTDDRSDLLRALRCVQAACLFPIGVKEVNKKCVTSLVNTCSAGLNMIHQMNDIRAVNKVFAPESSSESVSRGFSYVLEFLGVATDVLATILKQSKHYKTKLLKKFPKFLDVLVDLYNSILYLEVKWKVEGRKGMSLCNNLVDILELVKDNDTLDGDDIKSEDLTDTTRSSAPTSVHRSTEAGDSGLKGRSDNRQSEKKLCFKLEFIAVESVKADMVKQLVSVVAASGHDDEEDETALDELIRRLPSAAHYNYGRKNTKGKKKTASNNKVEPAVGMESMAPPEHSRTKVTPDLRCLQRPSSCYLIDYEHHTPASAHGLDKVFDAVMVMVDSANMEEGGATCENIIKIICTQVKAIHGVSTNGQQRGKYFLALGVVDLRDKVLAAVLEAWDGLKTGTSSADDLREGTRPSILHRLRRGHSKTNALMFSKFSLSVVPLSNYSTTMTSYSADFAAYMTTCYVAMETALHAQIKKHNQEGNMWRVNGFRSTIVPINRK
jgi:hypothetical protein